MDSTRPETYLRQYNFFIKLNFFVFLHIQFLSYTWLKRRIINCVIYISRPRYGSGRQRIYMCVYLDQAEDNLIDFSLGILWDELPLPFNTSSHRCIVRLQKISWMCVSEKACFNGFSISWILFLVLGFIPMEDGP